jgi:hypothetical protein
LQMAAIWEAMAKSADHHPRGSSGGSLT